MAFFEISVCDVSFDVFSFIRFAVIVLFPVFEMQSPFFHGWARIFSGFKELLLSRVLPCRGDVVSW